MVSFLSFFGLSYRAGGLAIADPAHAVTNLTLIPFLEVGHTVEKHNNIPLGSFENIGSSLEAKPWKEFISSIATPLQQPFLNICT